MVVHTAIIAITLVMRQPFMQRIVIAGQCRKLPKLQVSVCLDQFLQCFFLAIRSSLWKLRGSGIMFSPNKPVIKSSVDRGTNFRKSRRRGKSSCRRLSVQCLEACYWLQKEVDCEAKHKKTNTPVQPLEMNHLSPMKMRITVCQLSDIQVKKKN